MHEINKLTAISEDADYPILIFYEVFPWFHHMVLLFLN